ncbi:COX15/CtaA family protein [Pedococcus cremeus]|uniref:COX15/CtaA family protein n=1 Tax=Pedococcus cremeus TaxID=587636 RepID=UPI001FDF201A|nr:COX15/CtaA family protein [Pedococcus cremeus]
MTAAPPATAPSTRATSTHPWLPRILLANLVLEVLIVVTGGLVRLTGSGLGCPTWPECVPGSYVPVPEQAQGIHKYIEFGNRTLTGAVGFAAILVVYAVWRWAGRRRDLMVPAWVVLGGVVTQAVLGGITVRTGLNPATVSAHFLVSMVLVAASAFIVFRAQEPPGPRPLSVHPLVERLAGVACAVAAVVLLLGTVVTGSGPHSGDADEPARFGFDPRTISWLHADAVMLFIGLVVAVWVAARLSTRSRRASDAWRTVLLVTLAQGVVGYVQYLTGLPEVLVLVHMLLASLLVVALTAGVVRLRTTLPG